MFRAFSLNDFKAALDSVSPDTYRVEKAKKNLQEKFGEHVQFINQHKKVMQSLAKILKAVDDGMI